MFECGLDQFSFFFCLVLFVCFCFVLFCLFVCFFFPRLEELGHNTGEHKFTYNPLINFRDFIGYFGSRGTKSEGGCQHEEPQAVKFLSRNLIS